MRWTLLFDQAMGGNIFLFQKLTGPLIINHIKIISQFTIGILSNDWVGLHIAEGRFQPIADEKILSTEQLKLKLFLEGNDEP